MTCGWHRDWLEAKVMGPTQVHQKKITLKCWKVRADWQGLDLLWHTTKPKSSKSTRSPPFTNQTSSLTHLYEHLKCLQFNSRTPQSTTKSDARETSPTGWRPTPTNPRAATSAPFTPMHKTNFVESVDIHWLNPRPLHQPPTVLLNGMDSTKCSFYWCLHSW